jgi:hypothetical protein
MVIFVSRVLEYHFFVADFDDEGPFLVLKSDHRKSSENVLLTVTERTSEITEN